MRRVLLILLVCALLAPPGEASPPVAEATLFTVAKKTVAAAPAAVLLPPTTTTTTTNTTTTTTTTTATTATTQPATQATDVPPAGGTTTFLVSGVGVPPVVQSPASGTPVGSPTVLMPGTMTPAGSEAATMPAIMTTAASETTTTMGSATMSVSFQPESVPPILRTGWMLVNWQHEQKIIPYLDLPGWRLDYDLPAPVGGMFRMTVLVIACPDEGQARSAWRDLTELSSLPRRTMEFTYPGVVMSDFQQGRRGSPSASARAEPLMEYQSTVWLPPYLVQVLSQVRDHGAEELQEILDAVAR